MANGLTKGGPGSLLVAFLIWAGFMWAVNECFAEMVCYVPVPAPFVGFGGEWVDEALGFVMGWNFYLNMVPVWAVIVVMIVLYTLLNTISVRYFGISEFYFSIFKVSLIFGCFAYTFVTMVGGNPLHHSYGFRYWNGPGAFAEHHSGRLCGIVSCLIQATFAICGPEYISSIAAETENPRKILPKAFRSFVYRLIVFFVGSALCMSIVIPYDDTTLKAVFSGKVAGKGTSAASPYVISMQRLQIAGLASLVNGMIMTSVFSSGNGLLFSATRTLHGMALKKQASSFLSKCTKASVPIYALFATLRLCLLSFLQIGRSSAEVLVWLADLVTACQLLNYGFTAVTYLHFHAALKAQNISRDSLPYKGRFQPYTAYAAIGGTSVMLLLEGYDLFVDGGWSVMYFFLD